MAEATAAETTTFRAAFARHEATLPPNEPAWVGERRRTALARFLAQGFPTTHDEAWRFTSVAPLTRTAWTEAPGANGLARTALGDLTLGGAFAGHEIVFVNGRFAPQLSSLAPEKGLEIASLRAVLDSAPQRLEPVLDRTLTAEANVFAALNAAFLDEGAVVTVAPGTVVERPVHVLFFTTADAAGAVTHPRLLVLAGVKSQLTLLETHAGADGAAYFTNAVAEIVLEDGAVVDHYRVQREGRSASHVATTSVRQGRASSFRTQAVTLGAGLSRHDVTQTFAGEGGESTLDGLFLVDGTQHADTHTLIDHAQPHCTSHELYKGVVGGKGRGVFHGTIRVREGAQKTDAHQINKNLLLGRDALVNSTPALEILADDVKCKHGSTTGQLDPMALFYLRSRGISEADARGLLVYAFASDVIARIRLEPLRESLERHLRAHLPGAALPGTAGVA